MPHGFDRDGERRVLPWQSYDNMQAAGSVASSVLDLARWLRMHLDDGRLDGVTVLQPATLADPLRANQRLNVLFTTALDGFPANFLARSIEDAGLDLDEVKATPPGQIVDPGKARGRYKRIFSAGQGVGMVNEVQTTAELCDELIAQYREARVAVRDRLGGSAVVGAAACRGQAERRRG